VKAIVTKRYGGYENVELADIPVPQIGHEEILIQVDFASINPLDFKTLNGKLKFVQKYSFPKTLGNDLSGTVVKTGINVTKFKVGDEIYVRLNKDRIGAFAEFAIAHESEVAHKPKSLSLEEAAGVPLVALSAWQVLHDFIQRKPGQKVLIQAGSGGVGMFAIQFAKQAGAFVATTTTGAGGEFVKSLGADVVIDFMSQRIEKELSGYDAVFDTLGGEALEKAFSVVKPGGIVVSIAGLPTSRTMLDTEPSLFLKALLWLASFSTECKAKKAGVRYEYIFMRPDSAVHIGKTLFCPHSCKKCQCRRKYARNEFHI
jgi:alcohol dehydrogenase